MRSSVPKVGVSELCKSGEAELNTSKEECVHLIISALDCGCAVSGCSISYGDDSPEVMEYKQ